ncbi:hypothetical protein HB848_11205 [Listeria rocourtiae]|uniref:hypothetical protein n=1 Tax=Listeria rocourtiae TaxID=647910 RepID=UPI00162AE214|nr:hypothetical protein [Listeria rocourtiae]MBC1435905.1 hypothetical protein [Listeria rocourtiae]
MFIGVRMYVKIFYFITSMMPAYILFTIQIYFSYSPFSEKFLYLIVVSLFGIALIMGKSLELLLRKRVKMGSGYKNVGFRRISIKNRNSDVTSFLLGTILPSVILIDGSYLSSLFIFISLQLVLYKLVMRSSSIFPNVVLIMSKVDVCELENGNYIISSARFDNDERDGCYKLGDSKDCNVYVLSRKKEEETDGI